MHLSLVLCFNRVQSFRGLALQINKVNCEFVANINKPSKKELAMLLGVGSGVVVIVVAVTATPLPFLVQGIHYIKLHYISSHVYFI